MLGRFQGGHRDWTPTCDDLLVQLQLLVTALEAWSLLLAHVDAQSMHSCGGSGLFERGIKDSIVCGRLTSRRSPPSHGKRQLRTTEEGLLRALDDMYLSIPIPFRFRSSPCFISSIISSLNFLIAVPSAMS
ncbi:hypothetical protein HDV57DRAFT_240339 [Trichoderma longibrachiatum]|uniref:Uncharacterized protein n=1 Tax=Trichoderma longibrachiatum ATCC 18648 TaxID=983965 RepID=A0A2T4BZW0_TRILO|nr:hypothetical protein M440DRAFT_105235 [Trichoderma longibrachiatum ATCC 18648]